MQTNMFLITCLIWSFLANEFLYTIWAKRTKGIKLNYAKNRFRLSDYTKNDVYKRHWEFNDSLTIVPTSGIGVPTIPTYNQLNSF